MDGGAVAEFYNTNSSFSSIMKDERPPPQETDRTAVRVTPSARRKILFCILLALESIEITTPRVCAIIFVHA